jgi:ABC-type nitrate/sulfonate/bicarbonate transport system substrate-binding protein
MRLDESKIRQIIRQTIAQRLSEATGGVEVTNQILKAIEPEVERMWDDAVKNPAEAAKIVVAVDTSGSADEAVQKRQMENVAKLITNAGTGKIGYLEPAAFERTVKVLLSSGSSPVIKKDPGKAAYSHVIWEASTK